MPGLSGRLPECGERREVRPDNDLRPLRRRPLVCQVVPRRRALLGGRGMKYGGYTGKFLTVDLSTGATGTWDTPDEMAEKYLGGRGFIAKMLYDRLAPKIDPSGTRERDHLRHRPGDGDPGPDHGPDRHRREEPTDRHHLGKLHGRPLRRSGEVRGLRRDHHHGGLADAGDSGDRRRQGQLRDASGIWGKDTKESQDILRAELGEGFEIGAIGPAGENLVPIATFMHVQQRSRSWWVWSGVRLQETEGRGGTRHGRHNVWGRPRTSSSGDARRCTTSSWPIRCVRPSAMPARRGCSRS